MPYCSPKVVYSGPKVIHVPQTGYEYRHFNDHRDHDWNRSYERGR